MKNLFAEYISNAETAFLSERYDVSLKWCKLAIIEDPKNVQAYTAAGNACLVLNQLSCAEEYFEQAIALDSANGERYFDLGNICFGLEKYSQALKNYALAEQLGCSGEINQKLYYQIGILNHAMGDIESALLNFDKSEDAQSLNDDRKEIILKRIQIHFESGDFEKAENYAVQYKMLEPGEFKSYQLYFQILLQQHKIEKAKTVLDEAESFFTEDKSVQIEIMFNRALLCCFEAEAGHANMHEHFKNAIIILLKLEKMQGIPRDVVFEIYLTLAEIYLKLERKEKAVSYAEKVLDILDGKLDLSATIPLLSNEISDDELNDLAEDAMREIEERGLLEHCEFEEDEDGNVSMVIPDEILKAYSIQKEQNEVEVTLDNVTEQEELLERIAVLEYFEKAHFIILECSVAEMKYKKALQHTQMLKHSENMFYHYHALYSEAYIKMKISERNKSISQEANDLYDKAIAYFRKKTFEDAGDILAVTFRIRAYADIGQYEKALELTNVLPLDASEPLKKYIEKCKTAV